MSAITQLPENSQLSSIQPDVAMAKARRERQRALIVPREHGAWGLWLVPMITGAGVAFQEGSQIFPLILLTTAALALFWLRAPFESLLGTAAVRAESRDERRTARCFVLGLAGVAAVALGALLRAGHNADLWPLGAAVAAAFIAQALLKKLGRRARMLSEWSARLGSPPPLPPRTT